MRSRAAGAALALVLVACGQAGGTSPSPAIPSLDGRPLQACPALVRTASYCGTLSVLEDRSRPAGRRIGLRLMVFPAAQPAQGSPPVFFLAGGPGGAATEDWLHAPQLFPDVHRTHDIVLVDQRGTGGSNRLEAPEPPAGVDQVQWAESYLASLDADPRMYGTGSFADDIDQVRAALGYARVDLYGSSYGTTAAQYFIRRHPDRVGAAVLDGAPLIDYPILEMVASNSQRALDATLDRCLADPVCAAAYPDPRGDLERAFAGLAGGPVSGLSIAGLAGAVHELLVSGAPGAAAVPYLLHHSAAGDYSFALQVANVAQASDTTSRLVMSWVIRCSEPWAVFDPAAVARLGAGSYYQAAQETAARQQQAGCAVVPRAPLGAGDSTVPRTTAPVLFLVGQLDPQDPAEATATAKASMPNSWQLVAPYQGHVVGTISCLPTVVGGFFDSGRYNSRAGDACAATMKAPGFRIG